MPKLRLRLLGPPSVSVASEGTHEELRAAKCVALLAYLALEPGRHSRQALATLLWGDSDDTSARASLRQALKRLRDLAGDALSIDRRAVALVGEVDCDVLAFLQLTERNAPAAAGFDVAQFLAGFALQHAPAFEEWADAKRRELLRRYEEVLRGLVRDAVAHSRWRDAVTWAERWLTYDPLSDEAVGHLMEALFLGGDRAAALTRFREYSERVKQEIGSQPSGTIAALAERIAAESPVAADTRRPSDEVPAVTFEATLHGREAEWEAMLRAWNAACRGPGRIALIEGEAGLGKSRLALEFARWVGLEGATVLRGRGYGPQVPAPWGPVVELLRDALGAPGLAGTSPDWLSEATRLVPALRDRFPGLREPAPPGDAADRRRLIEAVVQIILALAAERPVLLCVDDLQWCDAETCGVLHLLTRHLASAHVLFLGTLSPGELEAESAAAMLCHSLRADARAVVSPLRHLTADETWALIRELGRVRRPDGGRRFASRIHQVTDGNPFYLIELLKTLFAQGLLTVDPATGEWAATAEPAAGGYEQVPMPPSVRDAIGHRVERLPADLREILTTIATSGRGARTHELSLVHGISRLRAAELGDELVERRLVVEEAGVYACAHPVIADVVRDSVTPSHRRELHRVLALALDQSAASDPGGSVAGEIARHAERGGEPAMAYRFALQASEEAVQRYAYRDGLAWLDLAGRVAAGPDQLEEVNRRTADVLGLAGWSERPSIGLRPSLPGRGIARGDVDLRAVEREGTGPR